MIAAILSNLRTIQAYKMTIHFACLEGSGKFFVSFEPVDEKP